ncbi:MAG TPA: hypothetical protein VMT85_24995 [Thermoanaerobaculia bacterium]|nr:hypothetical protein [Thermoanaerobaculia bacterium]
MAAQSSKKTAAKTATRTVTRIPLPAAVVKLQKRSLERQRSAFDATFQAVASFQEGGESALHNLLEGSSLVPKEWRQIADAWIETARQSRDSFRQTVDTSFGLAEQLVDRLGERAVAEA